MFAWVPWFKELAGKIGEGGPDYLAPRAKETPWSAAGQQAGLLKYGEENIDPFSFFYFLASKNDTQVWKRIHDAISEHFSIDPIRVTPEDGFYFPTPPGINALFHSQGKGKPELLWRLFRGAVQGLDAILEEDFESALAIKGTKIPKLTQALFLINPDKFLPCDAFSGFAVCGNRSAVRDWKTYRGELDVVRSSFPGCQPYEINMASYAFRMQKPLKIADRDWQLRTNYDETDHSAEMLDSNLVWTEGGLHPGCAAPTEPQRGDPVFLRYRREGRGIGVVWRNLSNDEAVKLEVLWLNRNRTESGRQLIPGPIHRFTGARSGKGRELVEAFLEMPHYRSTFRLLEHLGWTRPRPAKPDPAPAPDFDHLVQDTLIPEEELRRITELLEDKRQIIFQGPPGTGKTYLARKLAAFLAGNPDRVRLVQFHPSYAYEDFVQGFRPTLKDGIASFELRDGPLLQMAEAAQRGPRKKHFLVIDEINRGNLAKILGELYFLLEYREAKMRLQYSDKAFSLPRNLYIIGTMNTADRSIALVDLALRRRFHFVEFHPDRTPIKELLGRWLADNAPAMRWVEDVVRKANQKLDDRHAAIGPSYFMREGLDEAKVETIWQHNVLPYIEERLFGQEERLKDFDLDKLRDKPGKDVGGEEGTDSAEPESDDEKP